MYVCTYVRLLAFSLHVYMYVYSMYICMRVGILYVIMCGCIYVSMHLCIIYVCYLSTSTDVVKDVVILYLFPQ